MNLDEAVAQYKRALSSLLYSCGLGDLHAIEDSMPTLDAAVRNVALATAGCKLGDEARYCIGTGSSPKECEDCMNAEINRVFGKG